MLSSSPLAASKRFTDAENGLAGFALETGGRVFLGASAIGEQIAARILDDLSCVYLLSFDPGDLPKDRALSVRVDVERPKIETQYRARLFVDSAAARTQSRLETAFYNAEDGDQAMRVVVVPTGFAKGKYRALVQVALPGSPMLASTWEMGLTLARKGKAREQASGSISVNRAGVPIVFEAEVEFPPGPFEITGVAHETSTDQIVSQRVEGDWPDPDDGRAVLGPIAVLQPTYGAFLRGETHRTSGSLAIGPDDWISPDLPTALVGVACRHKKQAGLIVERRLEGASEASFDPVKLEDAAERCSVFIDVIRAGTMTSGRFTYGVRILDGEDSIAGRSRSFLSLTQEEIQLASEPSH